MCPRKEVPEGNGRYGSYTDSQFCAGVDLYHSLHLGQPCEPPLKSFPRPLSLTASHQSSCHAHELLWYPTA